MHCCRTIPVVDVENEANRRHPEPGQVEPEDVGVGIVIGMERKTAIDGRHRGEQADHEPAVADEYLSSQTRHETSTQIPDRGKLVPTA